MNRLIGKISGLKRNGELILVEVSHEGDLFYSIIINNKDKFIEENGRVELLFKETEVSLARNLSGDLSILNKFQATISDIQVGEILTKIELNYKGTSINSIIANSAKTNYALGETVTFLINANELMLSGISPTP